MDRLGLFTLSIEGRRENSAPSLTPFVSDEISLPLHLTRPLHTTAISIPSRFANRGDDLFIQALTNQKPTCECLDK
jgi:hypothetical protein